MAKYDICFEFENESDGSAVQLTYRLFDNDFSERWLKLFKRAVDKNVGIQDNGVFYGSALNDEDQCVSEMTETVNEINHHISKNKLDQHHIELKPHRGMSQEFLNDMHKRFEILRHEPGFKDEAVQKHLANLNTEVHRCEGFLQDFRGCHVEVNFNKVEYEDFEENDYKLFTPDKHFGYLYLTYGVTGVPVEAAFYAKPKDPPLPQPNYCSGCTLYFNNTYDFPFWDELGKWLRETWDWDVNDPKLTIGYIPLGELITPYKTEQEVIQKIAGHQKIRRVNLISKESENGQPFPETKSGFFEQVLEKIGLKKKRQPEPHG